MRGTINSGPYDDPYFQQPWATTAILGGFVYRGSLIDFGDVNNDGTVDQNDGRYFYGDFQQSIVRSIPIGSTTMPTFTDHTVDLEMDDPTKATFFDTNEFLGFGQDAAGELYVIRRDAFLGVGTIYRIEEE